MANGRVVDRVVVRISGWQWADGSVQARRRGGAPAGRVADVRPADARASPHADGGGRRMRAAELLRAMTLDPADETGLSAPHTAKGRLQRALLELLRVHERDGTAADQRAVPVLRAGAAGVISKTRHRGAAGRPEHERRADPPTRNRPGALGLDRRRDPHRAHVRHLAVRRRGVSIDSAQHTLAATAGTANPPR